MLNRYSTLLKLYIARMTCEWLIEILEAKAPRDTLTARKLINSEMLKIDAVIHANAPHTAKRQPITEIYWQA